MNAMQAVFENDKEALLFRDKLFNQWNIPAIKINKTTIPFVEQKGNECIVRYTTDSYEQYQDKIDNFEKFTDKEFKYETMLTHFKTNSNVVNIKGDTSKIILEELNNQNKSWKKKAQDIHTRIKQRHDGSDSFFLLL